jgi:hypothetical protein
VLGDDDFIPNRRSTERNPLLKADARSVGGGFLSALRRFGMTDRIIFVIIAK